MARPKAQINLMYYPTQAGIIEHLAPMFNFAARSWMPNQQYFVFDPCVADGEALNRVKYNWFADPSQVFTMGIELDHERAARAAQTLNLVMCGDGLDYKLECNGTWHSLVDLLFLNPPYDSVFDHEGEADRYELMFLDHWLPVLARSGTLIYVIRKSFMDRYRTDILQIFQREQMAGVKLFRFPDDTYKQFGQYVLVARKTTYHDAHWQHEGTLGEIPLDRMRRFAESYNYKATDYGVRGEQFKFFKLPTIDVVPFWETEDLNPFFGDPSHDFPINPLSAVRKEHSILLAAAGILNGLELPDAVTGEPRYVIKGLSEKIVITDSEPLKDETGTATGGYDKIETERYVHKLVLLDTFTGDITTVDDYNTPEEYEAFVLANGERLLAAVEKLYTPLYTADKFSQYADTFAQIRSAKRLPHVENHDGQMLPVQAETAAALAYGMETLNMVTCSGEMSVGKTIMSLAATWACLKKRPAKYHRIVVLCPAARDAVHKWQEEAEMLLGPLGAKVFVAVPTTQTVGKVKVTIEAKAAVDAAFANDGPSVIIMPETSAKLTSGWRNVIGDLRTKFKHGYVEMTKAQDNENPCPRFPEDLDGCAPEVLWTEDAATGERKLQRVINQDGIVCMQAEPDDEDIKWERDGKWYYRNKTTKQLQRAGKVYCKVRYTAGYMCPDCGEWIPPKAFGPKERENELKAVCPYCHTQLWTVAKNKRGGKVALARYIRQKYTRQYFLIIDEAHEYKSGSTARGFSSMDLIAGALRALQMTGTLMNGLPSSFYWLQWRSSWEFRTRYGHKDVQKFVNVYGLMRRVTRYIPSKSRTSWNGYDVYNQEPEEIPGMHPAMVLELLRGCVTLALPDLKYAMPQYTEWTVFVDMDADLKRAYDTFENSGGSMAKSAMKDGDHSIPSLYYNARMDVLDTLRPFSLSYKGQTATFGYHYDANVLAPKDELFLRIVQQEAKENRACLAFVPHINTGDPSWRLIPLLERYGLKGTVMRRDEGDRVKFIADAVRDGYNVIFTNPNLVQVSIDLIDTPTIIWYGVEYKITTYQQTNRRPWRLTQKRPVKVYYVAYNATPQSIAFSYVATKMLASLTFQGQRIAGLAAILGGDTFARRLQSLVMDKGRLSLDSDLTIDDFPPLPVLRPVEVVPEQSITKFQPAFLVKRWGTKANFQLLGVCKHCGLMLETDDVLEIARHPDGALYRFHQECVARYANGTAFQVTSVVVEA